jgi:hypothetical protein
MDNVMCEEISFDCFMASLEQSQASRFEVPAISSAISSDVRPIVGYIAMEGAARAAIFSPTSWGEFPR